jgi:D-glycero-D-manno-heptose 1,7-bisphosphate phosphatase
LELQPQVRYYFPLNKPPETYSKVLLIDRDNTINVDFGYTFESGMLKLIPKALNVLRLAYIAEIPVIVITNQSAIGRGKCLIEDVIQFNQMLVDKSSTGKNGIFAVIFCPHDPNNHCKCRKPEILSFELSFKLFKNAQFCYVGDSDTDKLAAMNAGIPFFQINEEDEYEALLEWIRRK